MERELNNYPNPASATPIESLLANKCFSRKQWVTDTCLPEHLFTNKTVTDTCMNASIARVGWQRWLRLGGVRRGLGEVAKQRVTDTCIYVNICSLSRRIVGRNKRSAVTAWSATPSTIPTLSHHAKPIEALLANFCCGRKQKVTDTCSSEHLFTSKTVTDTGIDASKTEGDRHLLYVNICSLVRRIVGRNKRSAVTE